jgi:simple sugar transport system permease protein
MRRSPPPPWVVIILAIAAAIVTAALCGLINGLIISAAGVPAIIATLGTNGLFLGLALALTGGSGVGGFPLEYIRIANSAFLGIPIPFYVFIFVAIALGILMERTSLGFQIRMLGSSPVAARFSGFSNRMILIKAFVVIAVLAGISAILLTSKVATMRPNYGQDYLLLAVLLSVLGGTNPDGGVQHRPGSCARDSHVADNRYGVHLPRIHSVLSELPVRCDAPWNYGDPFLPQ